TAELRRRAEVDRAGDQIGRASAAEVLLRRQRERVGDGIAVAVPERKAAAGIEAAGDGGGRQAGGAVDRDQVLRVGGGEIRLLRPVDGDLVDAGQGREERRGVDR